MFEKHIKGLQHIGIPTGNVPETVKFYEKLGFTVLFEQPPGTGSGRHVVFLECGGVMMECYEEQEMARAEGAVDHIALCTEDIDACYADVLSLNLPVVTAGIISLPFFEKGMRYFIITGYNGERIEFAQRLR